MMRRLYGAGPTHALLMGGGAVCIGYVGWRWLDAGAVNLAVWFGGSVVGHDLLIVPAYVGADRLLAHALKRRRWLINYVRMPAAFSLLLLAVWWPLILRHDPGRRPQTGLSTAPFMSRWLVISAALFTGSAVLATVSSVRRSRRSG